MTPADTVIGLSIGSRTVHAVEIEQWEGKDVLTSMDEWPSAILDPSAHDDVQVEFTESLRAFLRSTNSQARKASIAIDTSRLFVNTIPLDMELTDAEIEEHLAWEIRQYHPAFAPEEFITDTHTLQERPADGVVDVLSVSVRRTLTERMFTAVKRAGLAVHIVDADHFAAETALHLNYPDMRTRHLAMVGIKEDRLDVSVLRRGNMESYSYTLVQSNAEIVERFGIISRETNGVYSICAYGPHLDKYLLVDIRRASSMLVEALNPLRRITVSPELRLSENLTVPSYRFASAIGVALRRD